MPTVTIAGVTPTSSGVAVAWSSVPAANITSTVRIALSSFALNSASTRIIQVSDQDGLLPGVSGFTATVTGLNGASSYWVQCECDGSLSSKQIFNTLVPSTYPTSKKNALASLFQYVNDNVLDTNQSLFLGNYENAISFPSIAIVDKGAPDLAPTGFDEYLGQSGVFNDNQYGRVSQTVVEVNFMDKLTTSTGNPNPDAEKNVLLMRERFRRQLYLAGQQNNQGQIIYPNIALLNFDVNPVVSTGSYVYWPAEETNTWFESTYFANADDPLLKRIHVSMRLRWVEIQ